MPAFFPVADTGNGGAPSGNGSAGGTGSAGATGGASGGAGSAASLTMVERKGLKLSAIIARKSGIVGRLVATFRVTVPAAGTPIQLPTYRVPQNGVAELRALSSNTNPVFLSRNPAVAADASRISLAAFENPVILEVELLSEYWLNVTTNGEGVQILVKVKD